MLKKIRILDLSIKIKKVWGYVPLNLRDLIETILLSEIAAFSAILFLLGTNSLYSVTYLNFLKLNKINFIIYSLITITISSLIVGFLLFKITPEAAGSGIPQAKVSYKKDMGYIPIKNVLIKFIGGIISIGGGTSLGREGPSVFLGAGFASNLDGFLGKPKNFRKKAILIGSAAGLAAAFNTPIAAIVFVIEEIINDLNSKYLGHTLLASVLGAMTVHMFLGSQPAFKLPLIEKTSNIHYLVVPLVAIVSSFLGSIFQKYTILLRGRLRKISKIPGFIKPMIGGLLTWILGIIIFLLFGKIGVFGLGYEDLSNILIGNYFFIAAGIIALIKTLSTIFSYGFGGCGGIFAPTLFIGGSSGYFIASLASLLLPLNNSDIIILSVAGMSACLSSVVRAPLTSILIVFEMTHQFSMVPALVISVFISKLISRVINKENFYDAIIKQDGIDIHEIKVDINKESWRLLPVRNVMNMKLISLNLSNLNDIDTVIEEHNYRFFPVFLNDSKGKGNCIGIIEKEKLKNLINNAKLNKLKIKTTNSSSDIDKINKTEIEKNLKDEIVLLCEKPVFIENSKKLKDIANVFAKTNHFVLLVLDDEGNEVIGIISLHDLIRAQVAVEEY